MADDMIRNVGENELVCESCGGGFHYDQKRHCWKCDSLVCPSCVSIDNLCPECLSSDLPVQIEPMLAKTIKHLPGSGDRAFEFKWDGMRAITYWDGVSLNIYSRNQKSMGFRFPELTDLGKFLPENTIVDGEIIALDSENRPSFTTLQKRMHISPVTAARSLPPARIFYYLFDVLYLGGQNMMNLSYRQRRKALEGLSAIDHEHCRIPPSIENDPEKMLSVVRDFKLEGIIAKKLDSIYLPGQRSDAWVKYKIVKSREFIIGGYTYGQNSIDRIGSLQLGAYDNDLNLRYVGSTGTGFSAEDHQYLLSRLEPITISKNPFSDPSVKTGKYTQPLLVAQIEYRRWPKKGLVQQSSYKGLRFDKNPSEIKLKEL